MNFKKSLLLLLTVVLVFSCKQDELLDQNAGSADLTADLSQYDTSNLGLYKGTFTTLDASERGIVEVKILNNVPSRATITMVSGGVYSLLSTEVVTANQDVSSLNFVSTSESASSVSFDFSVSTLGETPLLTDVTLGNRVSSIIIAKETSRAPVVPVTGTFDCTTCAGHPSFGLGPQTFNMVLVSSPTGGTSTLSTDFTLNGTNFVSPETTPGQGQDFCGAAPTPGYTECGVQGSTAIGPHTVSWIGQHTYRDIAPDCSELVGVWSYDNPTWPGLEGTITGDVTCIPPAGDTVATAIPLTMLPAEGSGCVGPAYTVDLSASGGFTDSGTATTCTNGARDVFYSWTATTDGLTFTGLNPASTTIPLFQVLDATGTTEIACGDGSFGAITVSGWAVSDPLILRVAAGIEIPFCLEEFSVPGVPANDLCANAEPILCGATVMGNTVTATNSDASRGNDVWYTFDGTSQPAGTIVTVSLCGSGYDTWLGIYDDCLFTTTVTFSDDDCGAQSEVTFTNDGATNYVIRVDGFSAGDSGAYTLAVTCVTPPPPSSLTCGDDFLDSGGAAGNYSDNESNTYVIDAGAGLTPTLTFSEFQLDTGWDYMNIYDGPDVSATELTSFAGGTVTTDGVGFTGQGAASPGANSLEGVTVTSPTNSQTLTITFSSDTVDNFAGWIAPITCASPLTGGGTSEVTITRVNTQPARKRKPHTEAEKAERRRKVAEKAKDYENWKLKQ